ncbi:hypothetical protein BRC81_09000 [Halobacteriales archaeon QS_1_68_20]|nr:MAG: hypothetical protein BRC81_09000 [Halobacteriales archaeon QS_1_68_20]
MYLCEVVSLGLLLYLTSVVAEPLVVWATVPVLVYTAIITHFLARPEPERCFYLSFSWDVSFVLMGLAAMAVDLFVGAPVPSPTG